MSAPAHSRASGPALAQRERSGPEPARSWVVEQACVLVPTLLAMAVTAWRYDTKPLWRDEVYTLVTAGRPLPEMVQLLSVRDAGLGSYYLLMHVWLLVSHDPAWMRLPSALGAVAAVTVTAVLARRAGGNGAALLAGTTVALSQAVVLHAQEARPYPLVLAATAAVALLALRTTEDPRRARRITLAVVAVVAVGLHPLVALPAVAAILGASWMLPGRATRRQMTLTALPAAVLGVLLVLLGSVQAAARPPAPMPLWKLTTFSKLFAVDPLPSVIIGALAVTGALVLLRRRRPREALVLAAWAALPLVAISVLGLLGGYFNSRYASAATVPLAILAATGASAMITAGSARLQPAARAVAAPIAMSVLLLAVMASLAPGAAAFRDQAYYFDDAPAAAAQLAAQARPGDAVVFPGVVSRPLVTRYLPPGALTSGRLDDALLAPGDDHPPRLGGVTLPAEEQQASLAGRSRVWVVGTMAVATEDLTRASSSTQAAEAGRTLVSRTDHGHVRVELWSTGR